MILRLLNWMQLKSRKFKMTYGKPFPDKVCGMLALLTWFPFSCFLWPARKKAYFTPSHNCDACTRCTSYLEINFLQGQTRLLCHFHIAKTQTKRIMYSGQRQLSTVNPLFTGPLFTVPLHLPGLLPFPRYFYPDISQKKFSSEIWRGITGTWGSGLLHVVSSNNVMICALPPAF